MHPGTLPNYFSELTATLADPDLVRANDRDLNALLFSKWFETIRTGRYLIVVVVAQTDPKRPSREIILVDFIVRTHIN